MRHWDRVTAGTSCDPAVFSVGSVWPKWITMLQEHSHFHLVPERISQVLPAQSGGIESISSCALLYHVSFAEHSTCKLLLKKKWNGVVLLLVNLVTFIFWFHNSFSSVNLPQCDCVPTSLPCFHVLWCQNVLLTCISICLCEWYIHFCCALTVALCKKN